MTLAEWYPALRAAHVSLAVISGALFACRGIGTLLGAPAPSARSIRRLSQSIDTVLLLTAMGLLVILRLDPGRTPWLLAKLSLLVLYILFGIVALDRRWKRGVQAMAFVAALTCFGGIILTARAHRPLGFMALFIR